MKKFLIYVCVFVNIFYFSLDRVYAQEFQKNELISVDTVATVDTDKFLYENFAFSSVIDEKGNGVINFTSIKNKTDKKEPVSINILLFDSNKKNIGFLTYCTNKDLDSSYSGLEIDANAVIPFSIKVTRRYFSKDNTAALVKYIAVMDENKYCQIGGYSKYDGLTIEEIVGTSSSQKEKGLVIDWEKFSFLRDNLSMILILVIAFTIIGFFLNLLYRKMYSKTTVLAYLPGTNFFIATKMVFGGLIAKVYLVIFFLNIGLVVCNINLLNVILDVYDIIILLLVLAKLITKKYDLFYFDASRKNNLDIEPLANDFYNSNDDVNLNNTADYSENDNFTDYTANSNSNFMDYNVSEGVNSFSKKEDNTREKDNSNLLVDLFNNKQSSSNMSSSNPMNLNSSPDSRNNIFSNTNNSNNTNMFNSNNSNNMNNNISINSNGISSGSGSSEIDLSDKDDNWFDDEIGDDDE